MTAKPPVLTGDDEPHWESSEARQKRRQPNVNHDKASTIVAWDPRLALELAMSGSEPQKYMEVFDRYRIDHAAAVELIQNPLFLKQLEGYKQELEASGMSFRMKARVLAEDLLPEAYDIAKDPAYPAAVRADMIQWMTKIADLEPVKANGKDVAQTGGFSLQILFAGQVPQQSAVQDSAVTIDHQP